VVIKQLFFFESKCIKKYIKFILLFLITYFLNELTNKQLNYYIELIIRINFISLTKITELKKEIRKVNI